MFPEEIKECYDRQAGNYTQWAEQNQCYNRKYTGAIARIISKMNPTTLMEAGIGEGTTMTGVYNQITNKPLLSGFDLSQKRLDYIKLHGEFIQANMFDLPYEDNSFDVVYTSHTIEPNTNKEKEAIAELFRVTKHYLILLEPAFNFANDEGKARMLRLGYITNLPTAIKNYHVLAHRLFDYYFNELNPTGLTIIWKKLCIKLEKHSTSNKRYFITK